MIDKLKEYSIGDQNTCYGHRVPSNWGTDWTADDVKYTISTIEGMLTRTRTCYDNAILAFPTTEMRDAFYENFKKLIESVKELL